MNPNEEVREDTDDNWLYGGSRRKSESGTEKSNFICRLMKSKIIQPDHIFPVRSGEDGYGIPLVFFHTPPYPMGVERKQ